jgi:GNAT superfamily N-acetyltransferase
MTRADTVEIRAADLPRDRTAVERLWLEYLSWGNDEMEARHGFRLPVREAVERDLATLEKFQPPEGRLLLAFDGARACGIGCLKHIGVGTAEIKRMYVEPSIRRIGVGRAILGQLIAAADATGYARIWLDSPDFMTAAHALYRAHGFVDIGPYSESEIPDEYKPHWVFMERVKPSGPGGSAPRRSGPTG